MGDKSDAKKDVKRFAGIEIPPDLTKGNFFFLYFNTLVMGMIMAVPAIVQPAFLSDIIKIDQAFAGSINGLMQNMSQIATLLFVAAIGVLSDKVGRKILAFVGFLVTAAFFYPDEKVKAVLQSLQNDKKLKLGKIYEEQWFQFHLERMPPELMGPRGGRRVVFQRR